MRSVWRCIPLIHYLLWITGVTTTNGNPTWWYNAWSGFYDPRWLIIGGVIYWHHTCHVNRCYRPARVHTAAGDHVCRRHHPDKPTKPTAEQIVDAHNAARTS